MTTIRLHGLLSKTFGCVLKLHLGNLNYLISAIDSIKNGFRAKLNQLSQKGYNYFIQKDPEENIIHIMPYIGGSGRTAMIVIAVIVIIIAIIFTAGAASAGAGAFASALGSTSATAAAAGATAVTVAGVTMTASLAASIGLTLLSTGLSMLYSAVTMKTPEAKAMDSSGASLGGGSVAAQAAGKSYIFSSLNNAESQGSSVPLGYGKFKIGSKLINFSTKNTPTNIKTTDDFNINDSYSVFSNYLAQ